MLSSPNSSNQVLITALSVNNCWIKSRLYSDIVLTKGLQCSLIYFNLCCVQPIKATSGLCESPRCPGSYVGGIWCSDIHVSLVSCWHYIVLAMSPKFTVPYITQSGRHLLASCIPGNILFIWHTKSAIYASGVCIYIHK